MSTKIPNSVKSQPEVPVISNHEIISIVDSSDDNEFVDVTSTESSSNLIDDASFDPHGAFDDQHPGEDESEMRERILNRQDDTISNLADTIPTEDMRVDLRDSRLIWLTASIVKVTALVNHPSNKKYLTTLRYDAWGDEHDESLPWPHERIAKFHTYTKGVKCLVDLLGARAKEGKGKPCSTLWPSKVYFSMPHPGSTFAGEHLKGEPQVCVRPYPSSCPADWKKPSILHGGLFFDRKRLRRWSKNLRGLKPYRGFEKAWEEGENDQDTPGTLPIDPYEKGTLLKERFRVNTVGGEPVRGIWFHGGFADSGKGKPKIAKQIKKEAKQQIKKEVEEEIPVSTDSEEASQNIQADPIQEEEYQAPQYEPPPKYPPLTKIPQPNFGGIRQLQKSKLWGTSITMNGNETFIGSFSTQTQAFTAQKLATEDRPSASVQSFNNDEDPKRAIFLSSIAQTEHNWNPQHNFSLHDWTMQQIRHQGYLKEVLDGKARFEEYEHQKRKALLLQDMDVTPIKKKKRKMRKPKRVDIKNGCYVSTSGEVFKKNPVKMETTPKHKKSERKDGERTTPAYFV